MSDYRSEQYINARVQVKENNDKQRRSNIHSFITNYKPYCFQETNNTTNNVVSSITAIPVIASQQSIMNFEQESTHEEDTGIEIERIRSQSKREMVSIPTTSTTFKQPSSEQFDERKAGYSKKDLEQNKERFRATSHLSLGDKQPKLTSSMEIAKNSNKLNSFHGQSVNDAEMNANSKEEVSAFNFSSGQSQQLINLSIPRFFSNKVQTSSQQFISVNDSPKKGGGGFQDHRGTQQYLDDSMFGGESIEESKQSSPTMKVKSRSSARMIQTPNQRVQLRLATNPCISTITNRRRESGLLNTSTMLTKSMEIVSQTRITNNPSESTGEVESPVKQKNSINRNSNSALRKSIFTDQFQKTFLKSLRQMRFGKLKSATDLSTIEASIAKHFKDPFIKKYLKAQQEQQQQQQQQPSKLLVAKSETETTIVNQSRLIGSISTERGTKSALSTSENNKVTTSGSGSYFGLSYNHPQQTMQSKSQPRKLTIDSFLPPSLREKFKQSQMEQHQSNVVPKLAVSHQKDSSTSRNFSMSQILTSDIVVEEGVPKVTVMNIGNREERKILLKSKEPSDFKFQVFSPERIRQQQKLKQKQNDLGYSQANQSWLSSRSSVAIGKLSDNQSQGVNPKSQQVDPILQLRKITFSEMKQSFNSEQRSKSQYILQQLQQKPVVILNQQQQQQNIETQLPQEKNQSFSEIKINNSNFQGKKDEWKQEIMQEQQEKFKQMNLQRTQQFQAQRENPQQIIYQLQQEGHRQQKQQPHKLRPQLQSPKQIRKPSIVDWLRTTKTSDTNNTGTDGENDDFQLTSKNLSSEQQSKKFLEFLPIQPNNKQLKFTKFIKYPHK